MKIADCGFTIADLRSEISIPKSEILNQRTDYKDLIL